MHWNNGILKIAVHNEVCVRQPDVLVVVDRVQVVESRLVGIPQSGVIPLLLQQEFHFVFLEEVKFEQLRIVLELGRQEF